MSAIWSALKNSDMGRVEGRGRRAVPHKAKNRHKQWLTDEHDQAMQRRIKPVDPEEEFTRAASGKKGEGKAGTSEGPQPHNRWKVDQYRRQKGRRRDRDRDRGR